MGNRVIEKLDINGEALTQKIHECGYSIQQIGKLTDYSDRQIRTYLKMNKMPPEMYNRISTVLNGWTIIKPHIEDFDQNQKRYKEAYDRGYEDGMNEASEIFMRSGNKYSVSKMHDDFFDWLACAVTLDSDWEENPGFYREVICRKLVRLGKLKIDNDCYELIDPEKDI